MPLDLGGRLPAVERHPGGAAGRIAHQLAFVGAGLQQTVAGVEQVVALEHRELAEVVEVAEIVGAELQARPLVEVVGHLLEALADEEPHLLALVLEQLGLRPARRALVEGGPSLELPAITQAAASPSGEVAGEVLHPDRAARVDREGEVGHGVGAPGRRVGWRDVPVPCRLDALGGIARRLSRTPRRRPGFRVRASHG